MVTSANAAPIPLPLPGNFNFLDHTGTGTKSSFTSFAPTNWVYGNQGGLVFIASSSTSASNSSSPCGNTYLQTYGCPSHLNISGGYNVVEADGNPDYESGFSANITGLVTGTQYTLSFYQAASQQTMFNGATTNQWIVALGSPGSILKSVCPAHTTNAVICTYNDFTTGGQIDQNADITATTVMNVPSNGLVDWQYVSVTFTSEVTGAGTLSFLAWGNGGSTANEPPMAFLTGVDSPPGLTPEPASLGVLGVGFAALGRVAYRRRKRQASRTGA
jgi:PEP-CTERM motif